MLKLESISKGAVISGILAGKSVNVVDIEWHGDQALTLTWRDHDGRTGQELVFRDKEPFIEIVQAGRPWSFDGDGDLFRLAAEAYRIRLAHLFDPHLAVHTSDVEPLPHQITAVYGEMLPRQPLRYLLADDPGAGKTIMTGLLIKELMMRGDLKRCLVVCPGNLVEQWQDELDKRFHLPFEILTNDRLEAARSGNAFQEMPLLIARLDKLSRNEDIQARLKESEWDLVVCDEAHKMSASLFGGEVKYTKRYRLGQLLSTVTRHFLLLTATPHNGKEEDFQLFMALLDGDRFEGRFRDGVHVTDASDLMRRMVKEDLLKFDGRPLFPERLAYTVRYSLSEAEAKLYAEVTNYVREQFNRAENLDNDNRRGTVGFALTVLQRRLASSPEAIYQSLRRRKERLEKRLREEMLAQRGKQANVRWDSPTLNDDDIDDVDDLPVDEQEAIEDQLTDQATTARTLAELEAEIAELKRLEAMAQSLRESKLDRKWDELSSLLQQKDEMFDSYGARRKLVIFTEHRDTLRYLVDRLRTLIGRSEAVVSIEGGMGREDRRKAQETFTQEKQVVVLVATDAAGEGINLQRAHLMVNYDLPWNPNRLEQRFGRIHRIGQTEVCHLWSLVAHETREGDVFTRLFEKLEEERKALGGRVFDVLGKVQFENRPLRELLIEAIRYGEQEEVRDRLNKIVNEALNHDELQKLLDERALAHDSMDVRQVLNIRDEMDRIEARRLQPHFIASFFFQAFRQLGGRWHEREGRRFEITHVPNKIRARDRQIGSGSPVLSRYERVCFEKELIRVPGRPLASFLCPGHPLLEAATDIILEDYRDLLKRGTVLVDESSTDDNIRVLYCIEHSIRDGRVVGNSYRTISRRMQFVEIDEQGRTISGGPAPHLDYRPASDEERQKLDRFLSADWLTGELESPVMNHAIRSIVPTHMAEVKQFKEPLIQKTEHAVHERLTKEINYWDHRAFELKQQESAGRPNARLNSEMAARRAEELSARLKNRMSELHAERQIAPLPPVIIGGALVVPGTFLLQTDPSSTAPAPTFAADTRTSELIAMNAVIAKETASGFLPRDVSMGRIGYDIESARPDGGPLRFIEVKGRVTGASTVTITKNEILTALNKPDQFILALVDVENGEAKAIRYLQRPFRSEPDFGATCVVYNISDLLASGHLENDGHFT